MYVLEINNYWKAFQIIIIIIIIKKKTLTNVLLLNKNEWMNERNETNKI